MIALDEINRGAPVQRACLLNLQALPDRQLPGLRTRVSRLARTGTPGMASPAVRRNT
jgi:hypothetical protein